jgi:hypothetical protein
MSVSARKLAANRANAKKSTGPKSAATKEVCCGNAVVHGLAGAFRVLENEDQSQFFEFFHKLMCDENPVGSAEIELVGKMARHSWTAERALRLQDGCFTIKPVPDAPVPGATAVTVNRDLIELYMRYHAQHDRAYRRAAQELIQRRNERLKAERGSVSQKHREAEEERKTELHQCKVRTAKAVAEAHELRNGNAMYELIGPEGRQILTEMIENPNRIAHKASGNGASTGVGGQKAA